MNKFVFQAIVLLSVMHGVTVSMMHTKKALHMASLPKFSRNIYGASTDIRRKYEAEIATELAKIEAKCIILDANLSYDDRRFMFHEADKIYIRKKE